MIAIRKEEPIVGFREKGRFESPCSVDSIVFYCDNRTHYTISQSTV